MSMSKLITVEVAYALPDKQKIIEMQVEEGTTARQAVLASGIDNHFPGIDLENARLGIFGQALGTKGLEAAERYQLQPRDRVEIYRPLIADPKEVRRKRAEKAKQQRES
ncbi:RnfH family protein [Porticoccaceae bacterium LTM1]|nr:RnfH family protein [Porticoccaceae bacterium LTM1]